MVLAVVGLGPAMSSLDTFIVNVAIPSLRAHLHATPGEAEFVITAYSLTYAVLLITGGRLGDLYGRTRVYLVGMAVFTVASAVCGMAPSAPVLIAARVAQAAGGAAMVPQAYAVVQLSFAPQERVRAVSYLTSASSIAVILAQVVGGGLIQADIFSLGWRVVFLVNVPLGAVGVAAGLLILPRAIPVRSTGLDLPGVALASATLLLVTVPLVEGRDVGWPWWIFAMFAAFPLALAAFLQQQRRPAPGRRAPLVELSLFREPGFSVGVTLVSLTQVANAGLFFVLAVYLQSGRHLSPGLAGLAFAPLGCGYLMIAPFSPQVASRFGRGAVSSGYAIVALGAASMIAVLTLGGARVSPFALVPSIMLVGAGQGFVNSPLIGTVLSRVVAGHEGSASGLMTTLQQTGAAVGVAVEGLVFFSALGAAAVASERLAPAVASHAFSLALLLNVGIDCLAAAAVWLLPPMRRPGYADPPAQPVPIALPAPGAEHTLAPPGTAHTLAPPGTAHTLAPPGALGSGS